ncbi:MAG TPA: sigma-70 family RNA polymerase sigma factor [Micromonosporaceae bacterium]|nr:sigma-70 family RNA polymerase sigma factor [Micromonosporaceae bacterium]
MVGADFEAFYKANAHALAVQVYAYTGDLDQAQDLAHEAFVRALAQWPKVSTYEDPMAWLRRVAWNLATSRWRRSRTASAYLARQRVEHAAEPSPDRVALAAALATLPEPQRRVVILFYLAELTVAEIARHEGCAEGTVKSRLARGRAALAAQLAESAAESPVVDWPADARAEEVRHA